MLEKRCRVIEWSPIAAGEGKKKTLNAGRGGGTAGLDDYVYSEETLDNDYDFM